MTSQKSGVFARIAFSLLGLVLLVGSVESIADDIDVYTNQNKPNMLLLFDTSGSMLYGIGGSGDTDTPSRADILKDALTSVMLENTGRVNMGLALWNHRSSGIKWPITDLAIEANSIDPSITAGVTARTVIDNIVRNAYFGGLTSPVYGMYEAGMYFSGGEVRGPALGIADEDTHRPETWDSGIGSYTSDSYSAANPVTYTPANAYNDSGSGSWAGANYKSPVNACQSNYMLLLSDGQPSLEDKPFDIEDEVLALTGSPCADLSESMFLTGPGEKPAGNCGPELAHYLANTNMDPNVPGSTVSLYTIGLALSGGLDSKASKYLQLLADNGKGEHFLVESKEDLQDAINGIIVEIAGESENFTSPSVDINKASFSHDNRAFLSLFKPSSANSWVGNTKGYFLSSEGLLDINGQLATENTSGLINFKDTARSFWSTSVDGNQTDQGGAASKLNPAYRNLLTFTGTTSPSNASLNTANNKLTTSSSTTLLDPAWFGVGSQSERDALIDWLYNARMGDPLHSKPTSVTYADSTTVIYSMTNQGLLHAFDGTQPTEENGNVNGGEEIFGFIPQELLGNLKAIRDGSLNGEHVYGLDGGSTLWHKEKPESNDGIVNNGEKVYLFFGMRRGGKHYYAIDISDYENPVLAWRLSAGDPGFENMAQTWSRMSLVALHNQSEPDSTEWALIMGGGYDDSVLDDNPVSVAGEGNAIFAIEPLTGDLIWSISNTGATELNDQMVYSISSSPTVIDSDGNGFADRIYTGDHGGQLWRIDINDHGSVPGGLSAKRLAILGSTTEATHRPFFAAPSASLFVKNGERTLYVSIASGDRDNPLQAETANAVYAIKDPDIDPGVPTSAVPLEMGDLYNATDNLIVVPAQAAAEQQLLDDSDGWYVLLASGEKAFTEPVVYDNKLFFTTMESTTRMDPSTLCEVSESVGKLYGLNVVNATALGSDANFDPATQDNRYIEISTTGIPSEPSVLFTKDDGNVTIMVGKETLGEIAPTLEKVYWYQKK